MERKHHPALTLKLHTMTSQQILAADFLDILFDNRNKAYGAYELRKQYQVEMGKALTIAIAAVFLLIFFINPSSSAETILETPDVVMTSLTILKVDVPKTELPKLPPPQTQQHFRQQEFQNFKITEKQDVPPVATQTQLTDATVSNITEAGPNAMPTINPPKALENTAGTATQPAEPKKQAVAPDRQPQFPGGMQAWTTFLNHNLRAPQDLESGEKRTVGIRFHVDTDGTVTNFQIIQSGGAAFDNEVIRALKKMPKWTPALQAGAPVAVSFTQPVTFVGVEE